MAAIDLVTKQDLEDFKAAMLGEIKRILQGGAERASGKQWMRSADVRRLLDISAGTLQNLRLRGELQYSKIGGSMFYRTCDVERMIAKGSSLKSRRP